MEPQGVRLRWDQVAPTVRDEVAIALGSPITAATNQPGGFSPGVAARCRLADGRRCFIKAVSSDQNPDSPDIHRREASVAAGLPADRAVPALLSVVDDGRWVVLIFEEVVGEPPDQPWTLPLLGTTLAAVAELSTRTTPSPVPDLPTFAQRHARSFCGFRTLAGGDQAVDRLDRWSRANLDRLAALESGWEAAAGGDSLLHGDLRADNLLVRSDGTVVLVDWPHACTGAPWVDTLCLLPSVGLDGGPTLGQVEATFDPFAGVDDHAVDRVLTGLAGYFTYQALQPDPSGLPTLRAFQDAQGVVARAWLAERLAR